MKNITFGLLLTSLLLSSSLVADQVAEPLPDAAPVLEPNDPLDAQDDAVQPAATEEASAESRLGRQQVEEYRIQDHVVQMKITPNQGPSYYLDNPADAYDSAEPQGGISEKSNLRYWKLGEW